MFKTGLLHTACVCFAIVIGGSTLYLGLGRSPWTQIGMLPVFLVPWFVAARHYKKRFGSVIFAEDGKGAGRLMRYAFGGGLVWAPLVVLLAWGSDEFSALVLVVMSPVYYVLASVQVGAFIMVLGFLVPSRKSVA